MCIGLTSFVFMAIYTIDSVLNSITYICFFKPFKSAAACLTLLSSACVTYLRGAIGPCSCEPKGLIGLLTNTALRTPGVDILTSPTHAAGPNQSGSDVTTPAAGGSDSDSGCVHSSLSDMKWEQGWGLK